MGDQDELRVGRHRADGLVVTSHVGLVERGVDLVEHAEGRRPVLEDGEDQRDRRERLFAAAHQLDVAELLAGRLRDDLDAGVEHVVGVGQRELGPAAAEHAREGLPEQLVDRVEGLAEAPSGLAVHVLDGAVEIVEGLLDVELLRREIREAFLGVGPLTSGVQIDGAHAIDELRQLVDAPALLVVRHGASVVVAHHAPEVEAAETLAHVGEQVFALEFDTLQGHLGTAKRVVEVLHFLTQGLELRLAGAEGEAHLLEQGSRRVQLDVGHAGGLEGVDPGLACEHDLPCGLAQGAGGLEQVVDQALGPRLEIGDGRQHALLGTLGRFHLFPDLSQAHLTLGDQGRLRVHAFVPGGREGLGLGEIVAQVVEGGAGPFELGAGPALGVGGVRQLGVELGRLGADAGLAGGGARDLAGRSRQVFLGRDVSQLPGVGFLSRAVEARSHLAEARAKSRVVVVNAVVTARSSRSTSSASTRSSRFCSTIAAADVVAAAAADDAVGARHGAVEGDDRRPDVPLRNL